VRIAPELVGLPATPAMIEMEFANGTRMRISAPFDAEDAMAAIAALAAKDQQRWISVPSGVQVWLAWACRHAQGPRWAALLVRETLPRNPQSGYLFVFGSRRGSLIKVLWHDGQRMCLYAKRLEHGRFVWPSAAPREGADRTVTITSAQPGYICSKGSTGGCRNRRGARRPRAERDIVNQSRSKAHKRRVL
jgi:transposase